MQLSFQTDVSLSSVRSTIARKFGLLFSGGASASRVNEESIREAKLLRAVLNKIGQALWVDSLDKTKAVLNVGDYEKLYDRPRTNLFSDPLDWVKAIHPDDRPEVEAALPQQRTGKFDVTYRVIHRDGTVKWLHDRAFLLNDESGSPKYQAGLVVDITERVLLQERILHEQKVKNIGALTGGICHDFNNVLAVVLGNIELSLEATNAEDMREYLQTALSASQRGANLTRRLLAYSRKQPLTPTSVSPASMMADLEGFLRQSLSETVELEIVSAAGSWSCKADESELQTVLVNLAINAQDAMEKQGKLTIEVFNARIDEDYAQEHEEVVPGQYVCFAVSDNGKGMPPDVAALAFDPFFTTKDRGQGTGLGLSMAYGFAKQSGGHLKIYSELGQGTTIKLYLPRSTRSSVGQSSTNNPVTTDSLAGKSVLIVDNDLQVLRTVDLQMRAFGFETVSVGSAEEALSVIAEGCEFDLLLFDVVLGGSLSGPELAQRIATKYPEVRTLFMSGFTENAIVHDGELDAGVSLVQKPFNREALLLKVLRALE